MKCVRIACPGAKPPTRARGRLPDLRKRGTEQRTAASCPTAPAGNTGTRGAPRPPPHRGAATPHAGPAARGPPRAADAPGQAWRRSGPGAGAAGALLPPNQGVQRQRPRGRTASSLTQHVGPETESPTPASRRGCPRTAVCQRRLVPRPVSRDAHKEGRPLLPSPCGARGT